VVLSNASQKQTVMKVSLTDAGKRFNRDWIFRHVTYTFTTNNFYAITGPNGSGKSTLLQVLSGAMQPSEGTIEFTLSGNATTRIDGTQKTSGQPSPVNDNAFSYVSISAPYLEVIEEMNLKEFLKFHQHFKPFSSSVTIEKIISIIGLEEAANKQIRYYSSGMKQRVKLAQAIFSDTPLLLLDEPCTNLDTAGVALYHRLVHTYCTNRLVIISSNDEIEYNFCTERININDFKK
jgi:ABC-type multidrug transport system ATPase subunit